MKSRDATTLPERALTNTIKLDNTLIVFSKNKRKLKSQDGSCFLFEGNLRIWVVYPHNVPIKELHWELEGRGPLEQV